MDGGIQPVSAHNRHPSHETNVGRSVDFSMSGVDCRLLCQSVIVNWSLCVGRCGFDCCARLLCAGLCESDVMG